MKKYLFFILLLCFLISCASKQDPIKDLEQLNYELSQDTSNFTEKDWDAVMALMDKIDQDIELYYSEYTQEELKQIGYLKGQCVAQLTKIFMNDFSQEVEDLSYEAEGWLDGFVNSFSDDTEY